MSRPNFQVAAPPTPIPTIVAPVESAELKKAIAHDLAAKQPPTKAKAKKILEDNELPQPEVEKDKDGKDD